MLLKLCYFNFFSFLFAFPQTKRKKEKKKADDWAALKSPDQKLMIAPQELGRRKAELCLTYTWPMWFYSEYLGVAWRGRDISWLAGWIDWDSNPDWKKISLLFSFNPSRKKAWPSQCPWPAAPLLLARYPHCPRSKLGVRSDVSFVSFLRENTGRLI